MAVFIKIPIVSATHSKPFAISSSIARSNWLQSLWQVIVYSFRLVVDNWSRKDKLWPAFAKPYMNLQKERYTNGLGRGPSHSHHALFAVLDLQQDFPDLCGSWAGVKGSCWL
jgi:hypothetical protein